MTEMTGGGLRGATLGHASDVYNDEPDIDAANLDDRAMVTPNDHIWAKGMPPQLKFADDPPQPPGSHWEHGYPAKA